LTHLIDQIVDSLCNVQEQIANAFSHFTIYSTKLPTRFDNL
jgi:hypothetical protein